MKSKVFFANLRARNEKENRISKISRLFDLAGFSRVISERDLTAIKLHFGERGNDAFLNPVWVRQVVDKVLASGGRPFLTDTNTLYTGSRSNAVDHLITAIEHGFDYAVVGAPVIIADGLKSKNSVEVEINKKNFKTVKIAGDIFFADSMIVLSHFKGHVEAGFGGAIKNLAMGCAPAAGKQRQHSAMKPQVKKEKCTACKKCFEVCPAGAISFATGKALIDHEICIGCGECISVCPVRAISPNWESDVPSFLERMVEHAYGALVNKRGKVGFMNFLINVVPDCDCLPWSDAPIVPDIGILASLDPVAIDAASLDLVNRAHGFSDSLLVKNLAPGEDKFTGIRDRDRIAHWHQLEYAQEIGLGSMEYELKEI
ncbi:MAG: DUF362 domain-containing protein [Caldiserica bacterium]|jgi:uncharacterized Fe-S center protein|nr:DUF362 domain-containing protein [Caldisericota bacterium]MDH7562000.1 DUF362 domain-containing protein [Caldisericota bacterium]